MILQIHTHNIITYWLIVHWTLRNKINETLNKISSFSHKSTLNILSGAILFRPRHVKYIFMLFTLNQARNLNCNRNEIIIHREKCTDFWITPGTPLPAVRSIEKTTGSLLSAFAILITIFNNDSSLPTFATTVPTCAGHFSHCSLYRYSV